MYFIQLGKLSSVYIEFVIKPGSPCACLWGGVGWGWGGGFPVTSEFVIKPGSCCVSGNTKH